MTHDKKREKFKDESQDGRRRDMHNVVHPDDKASKNSQYRHDKKK